jgi:hypothetical protein
VHDDGRAGADGRAGYQITPGEGQVEQQPGLTRKNPNCSATSTAPATIASQSEWLAATDRSVRAAPVPASSKISHAAPRRYFWMPRSGAMVKARA